MLVVFLDLFREADILFVRSETTKKRRRNTNKEDEHWFFAFFRQMIHIKIYRMLISHFLYGTYLCLLILMVWNQDLHRNYWNHWYSNLAQFFAFTLLVDDIISLVDDIISHSGAQRFFQSFWNPYNLTKNLIMVVGLLVGALSDDLNRANLDGNHPLNIAGSLVSIALGLEIFVLLKMVISSESLGPVCLCLTSVFKDVLRMMPVYTLIFAAHAIAALSLFVPFQERNPNNHNYTLVEDHLSSRKNLLSSMWWRVIFSNNANSANIKLRGGEDEDFSFEFFHFVCMAVWAGNFFGSHLIESCFDPLSVPDPGVHPHAQHPDCHHGKNHLYIDH